MLNVVVVVVSAAVEAVEVNAEVVAGALVLLGGANVGAMSAAVVAVVAVVAAVAAVVVT